MLTFSDTIHTKTCVSAVFIVHFELELQILCYDVAEHRIEKYPGWTKN